MTALEAIIEEIEAIGYHYELGFGGDILDWLQDTTLPKTTLVFIQIGPETPEGYLSDGHSTRIKGEFTLWFRQRVTKGKVLETYSTYRELRQRLDGKRYGENRLKLTQAIPDVSGGIAQPQIAIEAVVD